MENGDVDTMANDTVVSILDFMQNRRPVELLTTSINMVPKGLRDVSPSSYDPRVVCFGPLHREDPNVQYYEELKAHFVTRLLKDLDSPPEETLKECVQKVLPSVDRIRACYVGTNITSYNDMELAKMMVIDACSIINFIVALTSSTGIGNRLENTSRGTAIMYDLVLLENQIPFFVLEQFFDCIIPKSPRKIPSLPDLLFDFAEYLNIFDASMKLGKDPPSPPYDHILGFLAKCYWPSDKYPTSFAIPRSAIHSTMELDRAGIIFKPHRSRDWHMAMEFKPSAWFSWPRHNKPTLRMPVLRIDNYTELVLRNLIAYEQYFGISTYVTSYVMAMDMLVDSEEDIAKLIESGVIINHLGSNEQAANAVNSMCKELPMLNFCYYKAWQGMDAHYNRYWPKNIAELKRTYFGSP